MNRAQERKFKRQKRQQRLRPGPTPDTVRIPSKGLNEATVDAFLKAFAGMDDAQERSYLTTFGAPLPTRGWSRDVVRGGFVREHLRVFATYERPDDVLPELSAEAREAFGITQRQLDATFAHGRIHLSVSTSLGEMTTEDWVAVLGDFIVVHGIQPTEVHGPGASVMQQPRGPVYHVYAQVPDHLPDTVGTMS